MLPEDNYIIDPTDPEGERKIYIPTGRRAYIPDFEPAKVWIPPTEEDLLKEQMNKFTTLNSSLKKEQLEVKYAKIKVDHLRNLKKLLFSIPFWVAQDIVISIFVPTLIWSCLFWSAALATVSVPLYRKVYHEHDGLNARMRVYDEAVLRQNEIESQIGQL